MNDKATWPLPEIPPSAQRLEAALGSWRHWSPAPASRPLVVKEMPGGKTNHSWRLETDCGPAVLRLNCRHDHLLGIDRQREHRILLAVVAAGIAPELWYNDPAAGFMVCGYIEGRVWCQTDFDNPSSQQRLLALVDRYSSLSVSLPAFDYLAHLDHYHQQLEESGIALPTELRDKLQRWREPIAAWQRDSWQPRLTHHDLTPANIIENDSGISIIDWEYAALGCADLDRQALQGTRSQNTASQNPLVSAWGS